MLVHFDELHHTEVRDFPGEALIDVQVEVYVVENSTVDCILANRHCSERPRREPGTAMRNKCASTMVAISEIWGGRVGDMRPRRGLCGSSLWPTLSSTTPVRITAGE